ncbi:MAG: hypothetical protein JWN15_2828, partial [Firmicutes bacterium]|nr:hypothetical protein [Bacillota bacterium]
IVGLTSLWDGMGQREERVTIGYTWPAPVLFLAFKSGWAASVLDEADPKSIDHIEGWARRLHVLVRILVLNLRRNGFEPDRVESVLRCAPLLAGAVHEWVRLGGLTGGPREGTNFDPTVYQTMKTICDNLRSPGSM